LKKVIETANNSQNIDSIELHVQISNKNAIELYKKFGFESSDVIENYYKALGENDAFKMVKVLKSDKNFIPQ
jgi:ribosomal protein S18 acetylase RimI-like enzyme